MVVGRDAGTPPHTRPETLAEPRSAGSHVRHTHGRTGGQNWEDMTDSQKSLALNGSCAHTQTHTHTHTHARMCVCVCVCVCVCAHEPIT